MFAFAQQKLKPLRAVPNQERSGHRSAEVRDELITWRKALQTWNTAAGSLSGSGSHRQKFTMFNQCRRSDQNPSVVPPRMTAVHAGYIVDAIVFAHRQGKLNQGLGVYEALDIALG